MGLCSHNGLLVMLLFHLCQAQDDVLPSPDPEPALPSLGDVIDAVKAAFEHAVQISATGAVREALEHVVEEITPQKMPAEQSPVIENAADHTIEEAAEEEAVVPSEGDPDVHISESNEQIYEEKTLAQDIEPAEEIQGRIAKDESSVSELEQKLVIKPVELEATDSVQEPVESVLQDPEIVGVGELMTEESQSEESPVQTYSVTQKENESGRGAGEMNKGAGLIEDKEKIEDVEVTIGVGEAKVEVSQEEESVERQEGDTESEHSEEEWQAVTAQMGTDGGVIDMDEVEQKEEEQGAAKTEESVIEVEATKEEVEAGSEAQHQVPREEEVLPTDKTVPEKTQQEAEVTVDTKGPIKLQEPVITKSKATGGKTHEASNVNEIIASKNPNEKNQGEPVLMNTIEEIPPTPILKLRLGDTDAQMEEHVESTQSKAIGQDAWKIGAIAAAFFLILQTAVTIVYILKCRRKPNRSVDPKNQCAGGNGDVECDANNTDTTISIDEQTAVDDLPEYSQTQQEDVAMTTIPLDSTEKSSSYDPKTSAA